MGGRIRERVKKQKERENVDKERESAHWELIPTKIFCYKSIQMLKVLLQYIKLCETKSPNS